MKKWCLYIFGVICCFILLAHRPYREIFYLEASVAEAGGLADSAWPCKGYNAKRSGQSPYAGAQTNTLKWSYTTGDLIYSSPALDKDGTIYFGGCDENDGQFYDKIYALDPNGSLKWSYDTDDVIDSSPAISADGTIYIGCYNGKLYAVNQTGLLKWSYQGEGCIYSSPVLDSEGTIYFACESGKTYALNPDGTLKWSYTAYGGIYSSPAISDDKVIYIGSEDGCLYALNPNGQFKWKYQTDYCIYSSPAIDAQGIIYIGSYDSKIYALKPDGTLKWSYTTGDSIEASPAIGSDGTIYIGSLDCMIYALNPDGTLKWSYTAGDSFYSSPAIDKDGTIYIGCADNKIYALGPEGTITWSYTTGDEIYSSPAIGKDGTIYVGSCDSKLYAFGASSEDPNTPSDPPPSQDTTAPVITCPDNMIVSTTRELTEVSYEAEVTDDTDANPRVMYYPASGSLFPVGITEVAIISTDASGNSGTCTFLVKILMDEDEPLPNQDTTAPVITCPDMLVTTTTELTEVSYEAQVTDDTDPNSQVMYYPESGSLFPVGITEVAIIATDKSGNSSTYNLSVEVIMDENAPLPNQDTTAPVVTCHDMIVLTTQELTKVDYEIEVTDDQDTDPNVVHYPESGSLFPLGETEVAIIATDKSGNSAIYTFWVTVKMDENVPPPSQDTTAPVITCHDMIVLTTKELTKVNYEVEVTDDQDADPNVVHYPESGSLFPLGETKVAIIATDKSGNSSTYTFLVTVIMDEDVPSDSDPNYTTGQSEDDPSKTSFPSDHGCFINSLHPSPQSFTENCNAFSLALLYPKCKITLWERLQNHLSQIQRFFHHLFQQ